jgi:hypothetical protein
VSVSCHGCLVPFLEALIITSSKGTAHSLWFSSSFSAGIIGLDVALVLAERGLGPFITVIAEHLPGDTSATYTSPWSVKCPVYPILTSAV